jgi:hypothetical protein
MKQATVWFVILLYSFSHFSCGKIIETINGKKLSSLQSNTIYMNEKASKNLRLRSVLNLNVKNDASFTDPNSVKQIGQSPGSKINKIYWSFKRIYTLPKFSAVPNAIVKAQNEMSQIEVMISLDNEVQDNLREKYTISSSKNSEFDLIINNLTYADSGIYKCNLWNQKTIYYHLIVSSK